LGAFRMGAAIAAVTIAIVCATLMAPALAQDFPPPMPDPGTYGAASGAPQAAMSLPAPDPDPGGDGSSVTVPIPGGGAVSADGPALDPQNFPPPTETWTTQGQTPNTVGGLPIGP
jgi:hypothetical protein